MKYVADGLTISRIVISAFLLVWALLDVLGVAALSYLVALIFVVYAFLSDALDGISARRWPYSEEEKSRIPWHRTTESAHAFDNAGDLLLYLAVAVSLAADNTVWWLLLAIAMTGSLVIVVMVEALMRRQSPLAETIDVIYGWLFGLTLGAMVVCLAIVALPNGVWRVPVAVGIITAIVLVPFKWDRLTTRPERRIT